MTSIRLRVLDQVCKTPGKTCKWLSIEMGIGIESVRGAIYTLEADCLIRKVSGSSNPYAYEPDKLRGVSGKQLPEFAESLRVQQVNEYTQTWKPARDMGEFLRSLRP